MKVGVTGHQRRKSIDWAWVKAELEKVFEDLAPPVEAYGSLAEGADQIFAQVALESHAKLVAVIPKDDYAKHFSGEAERMFNSLLMHSTVLELSLTCPDEEAFQIAGQKIVDEVDLLLAVWDGGPARGKGGTADIVAYAQSVGRKIRHLDPIRKAVREL